MINENILQIKTTIPRYLEMLNSDEKGDIDLYDYDDYWKILPTYIISRCPICHNEYCEQLDTYSLRNWRQPYNGVNVFFDKKSTLIRCNHFVCVHPFINFNGLTPVKSPTEISYKSYFISEQPHVIGVLLADDTGCMGVMHSIPLCRIEDNTFIPRYTIYIITYYAPENEFKMLLARLNERVLPHYYGRLIWPQEWNEDEQFWFDLHSWVKKKRLFWLDPETKTLPLKKGPAEKFPYGNIQGRRYPYIQSYPPDPRILKQREENIKRREKLAKKKKQKKEKE